MIAVQCTDGLSWVNIRIIIIIITYRCADAWKYSDRCAHLTEITQYPHTNIFVRHARLARMPRLSGLSLDELIAFDINNRIELKVAS